MLSAFILQVLLIKSSSSLVYCSSLPPYPTIRIYSSISTDPSSRSECNAQDATELRTKFLCQSSLSSFSQSSYFYSFPMFSVRQISSDLSRISSFLSASKFIAFSVNKALNRSGQLSVQYVESTTEYTSRRSQPISLPVFCLERRFEKNLVSFSQDGQRLSGLIMKFLTKTAIMSEDFLSDLTTSDSMLAPSIVFV